MDFLDKYTLYAPFHPRRVTVLDLPPLADADALADALAAYFSNFGEVVGVRGKGDGAAVVEFDSAAAAEATLHMAPHMVCRAPVRVLRAPKPRLHPRPFPGMRRDTSPLNLAWAAAK